MADHTTKADEHLSSGLQLPLLPHQLQQSHLPQKPSSSHPLSIETGARSNDSPYPSPPLLPLPALLTDAAGKDNDVARRAGGREVVAVDLDETLAVTHDAIIEYHNLRYGTRNRPDEFAWGCDSKECAARVVSFMQSDEWHSLIKPIPHALEVLLALREQYSFIIITSRPSCVEPTTRRFLNNHYPGIFDDIIFVGGPGPSPTPTTTTTPQPSVALSTSSPSTSKRTKSQACHDIGATILVDDSIEHAVDCATNGIDVLLFDLDGGYGWNKSRPAWGRGAERGYCPAGKAGVARRVKCWREVGRALEERMRRRGVVSGQDVGGEEGKGIGFGKMGEEVCVS
ncbi:hypothetical protein HDU67_006083 [Dinochytrium kinnereticum]|nr:hypothetical protein HDU67_006083 [Dinochytrium kinnereticum]